MIKKKNLCIALFAYNRPSHLRRVLISLESYKIEQVYIFIDGPRNNKDKIIQQEIKFITKYNPYIKVNITKSKKNKGLAASITNGINILSKKYENIIILEDDCIPRKEFFIFVNKILKNSFYKNDPRPICGYQFPEIHNQNSKIIFPIFLKYFVPWGWCISSDYWKKYQIFLKKRKSKSIKDNLLKKINILTKKKRNKIWSEKFIEYNVLINKEIIFPNISLIKNIGFDGSGINSSITNKFNTFYSKVKKIKIKFDDSKNRDIKNKQTKILLKSIKYFY
tara:strand:+ start:167 stop:1003 length:837 start_codon:yes stop_codon:yes gene_type:complete